MLGSESVRVNDQELIAMRKLVARGEGLNLEFKRKAAHPDKIVKELIAFANAQGGTLLIGVDDNGTIPGVKYPEEELLSVQEALRKHCRPMLSVSDKIIAVSPKHFVVQLDVTITDHRPHYFLSPPAPKESFVRSGDMSVRASREMLEIVRRSKKNNGTRFSFGDAEKKLMEYLEKENNITLDQFRQLTGLNKYLSTRKLVLLVLANVLRIAPTERGDVFYRV